MTSSDDTNTRVDFAGIQALSSRGPGYAVALKCLEIQTRAEARDPSLRTANGITLCDEAWSWYTGALGEIEVGGMLATLGPEWFVRHSVPIGAGTKDVDHLVIGPGGVFAINTKHHRGLPVWIGDRILRVNNVNTWHLKNAQDDGMDVARRIHGKVGFSVAVTPMIAIVNAQSIVDGRTTENRPVEVVDAAELVAWLAARPRVLDDTALALIRLAAEEPETWHIDPRAADTLRVMQRFERLAAQVGTPDPPARTKARAATGSSRRPANRPATRTGVRSPKKKRTTVGDLLGLWFVTGIIIAALFMLRGYADQPCTTAVGCILPPLYLTVKPILILGGVIAIAVGVIRTVVLTARIIRGS